MGQHVPFNETELQEDLNNFFCHFHIGNDPYPTDQPEGFYRNVGRGGKFAGRTYRDFVAEFSGLSGKDLEEYFVDRSDKRLSQTPEQFYAEIDRTIREVGIDMEKLQREINVYTHDRSLDNWKNDKKMFENLCKLLMPIYIALRRKGYNREDLVA